MPNINYLADASEEVGDISGFAGLHAGVEGGMDVAVPTRGPLSAPVPDLI